VNWRWLVLAVVALGLRGAGAVVRPPWHDEYFTVWLASGTWRHILSALRLDSGPPLLYAATKLLCLVGLPPLAAARTLTVLAGTAAVLLAARAARQRFGQDAGWRCGALLAVHPLALAWACEARAYALLLLAVTWAWERLTRIETQQCGAAGLALAVALACWSHAFGLILAGTLVLVAFTMPRAQRRTTLLAVGAGVATWLPWLPIAAAQPPAAIAWMVPAWRALPLTERLLAPFRLLPPVAPFGAHLDLISAPAALQLAAAVACLYLLVRSRADSRIFLLWLLPAAGLTALATFGAPAFYLGRGEALFLAPALAVLAVGATRGRIATAVAAVLVAGGLLLSAASVRAWAQRPPTAEAQLARTLGQALPRGGTVVVGGYWRLGLDYHLRRDGVRCTLVNYPAAAADHPGWYDDSEHPQPGELEQLRTRVGQPANANPAAVVVSPGLVTVPDLERLARSLGLQPAFEVRGAVVWLAPTRNLVPTVS
jgi:hypothetical protein